jgi:hypothetical protein
MSLKSHDVIDLFYGMSFPILADGIFIIVKLNDRQMMSGLSPTLVPTLDCPKSGFVGLKSVHDKIMNAENSISRCEVYATN